MLNPVAADSLAEDVPVRQNSAHKLPRREWLAKIALVYAKRRDKTALITNTHSGPLSVQRPFYPEGDSCCHTYLLHPPGGLAPGDCIDINVGLEKNTHALITTPSAGKIYRTDAASHLQQQIVNTQVDEGSCLEWLPQETIVFAGSNAKIHNRFQLQGDAKLIAWDVVCLGRRASNEFFEHGYCEQLIEIERDGELLLREKNAWQGDSSLMQAPWGMAGNTVAGTMIATIDVDRQHIDAWREQLLNAALAGEWGITQKPQVFIARYLGQSAQTCRQGFELLWQNLRPVLLNSDSCRPRIWNT